LVLAVLPSAVLLPLEELLPLAVLRLALVYMVLVLVLLP
jgi:hypothetical protein